MTDDNLTYRATRQERPFGAADGLLPPLAPLVCGADPVAVFSWCGFLSFERKPKNKNNPGCNTTRDRPNAWTNHACLLFEQALCELSSRTWKITHLNTLIFFIKRFPFLCGVFLALTACTLKTKWSFGGRFSVCLNSESGPLGLWEGRKGH